MCDTEETLLSAAKQLENCNKGLLNIIRNLIILSGILILLLSITNIAWLYVFNSYEYKTITLEAADGIANYIGEDGIITNGENYSKESD